MKKNKNILDFLVIINYGKNIELKEHSKGSDNMNTKEIQEIYQGLKEVGETDENIQKFINTLIISDSLPKTKEDCFRIKQKRYYSEREANGNYYESLSATAKSKEI